MKPNAIKQISDSLQYKTLIWDDLFVSVNVSLFNAGGSPETHAILQNKNNSMDAVEQFEALTSATKRLQQSDFLKDCQPVMKRYFVSDAVNQLKYIPVEDEVAVSIVQQSPLNETKVSLWVYWIGNCQIKKLADNTVMVHRPNYKHFYTAGMQNPKQEEEIETDLILARYERLLRRYNCTLRDNCIRTWIYVQGVDVHYQGMVNARTHFFNKAGLTTDTHYIASTGIEGKSIYPNALVSMDAYCVKGICPEQVTYLKGLSHLNPPIEYGVTFERATVVDYGDRRHIYVSGTASINNEGNVVHPFNIGKQLDRALENIQVLLKEGDASMADIAYMIVYLRDIADYTMVNYYLNALYPDIPKVIVWAPVCRPGWLVEIECMAVKTMFNKQFPDY